MTYPMAMLDLIDQRVGVALVHGTHVATMTSRDTSGPGGAATFDGSGLAVPVKVPASVEAFAGDRVGLVKFGTSDWVVVYCFTQWQESYANLNAILTADATASASFVNMAGPQQFTWRKRYDTTRGEFALASGMFTNATGAEADFGVSLSLDGATAVDHYITTQHMTTVNHYCVSGFITLTGLLAGVYTVTARWRAIAGTISTSAADTLSISAREIGPLHP